MATDDKHNREAEQDEADKLVKELAKEETGLKNAQRFLIYLAILLVVLWILFFKIIGITHMPTEDMSPRIDAGDLIVFYRLDRTPKFQDVVVFEKDIDGSGKKTMMIGRVMAVPGDTVDISAGNHLVVNGNSIVEPMIYTLTPRREDRVAYPLTMGEEQYFILVDSRQDGMDSRYFGPVSKDEILGMVITLVRRTKL
ncbi:MAG: signal peptidase I [Lachnospiraceae bacterium]|nr:signal peptidase I [Lachnospiraceae bacterium]